jgi:hypothetical protein
VLIMKKALLFVAAAVAGLLAPGVAQAETPPGCASAYQLGPTAYVKMGGQTAASVKQFAGCGKNWSYVFVWADWAARYDLFHVTTAVVTTSDNKEHGKVLGRLDQREVWSSPTSTTGRCTRALGVVSLGEDGWSAYTNRDC